MSLYLAPVANWFSNFGSNTADSSPSSPLSGGLLLTYAAGSTTPQATFTSSAGNIANGNPIVLDSTGRAPNPIWLTGGVAYKFVLEDSGGNIIPNGTLDNVNGVNDPATINISEWQPSGFAPIYSSASQFTTAANSSSTFQVGRRIQATVTAGVVYGTITVVTWISATTVTVAMDPGMVLDNGLSAVNVGLLGGTYPSVPNNFVNYPITAISFTGQTLSLSKQVSFSAYTSSSTTSGTALIFDTVNFNVSPTNVGPYNNLSGIFTAPFTGTYVFNFTGTVVNRSGAVVAEYIYLTVGGNSAEFAQFTLATGDPNTTAGVQATFSITGVHQMTFGQTAFITSSNAFQHTSGLDYFVLPIGAYFSGYQLS